MSETRVQDVMKVLAVWLIVIGIYLLLYEGLREGLWPMIANFRHMDWRIPALVDGFMGSVVIPLIVGCLIAGALRQRLSGSPWPVLLAPVIMIVVLGYTSDSFYPPWWNEALARLASGAVQGVFAWAGWFICRRLSVRVLAGD